VVLKIGKDMGFEGWGKQAAMDILALARSILSENKWEAPRGDRRNWRRRKNDGTYEYRESPPDGESKSVQDESKVTQDGKPEVKKDAPAKKRIVYKKYLRLDKPKLKETLTKGHYSLVSAGRNGSDPKESPMSPDDEFFHNRHEELRKELEKAGLAYTEVVGHYGSKESTFLVFHDDTELTSKTQKSMMVHHRDSDEAKEHVKIIEELGKKFNQDSVLHGLGGRNEVVFTTGKKAGSKCGGNGWKEVPEAEDFYTDIELAGKQHTKFSLDIHECFEKGML
jgi:hypothetical protein